MIAMMDEPKKVPPSDDCPRTPQKAKGKELGAGGLVREMSLKIEDLER